MAAFALEVAEQAAAGLVTVPGELAAGRWRLPEMIPTRPRGVLGG
jgi:hypothetical protein